MSHIDPETLSAWRDGDLTPDRMSEVEAHVRGCDVCRQEVAALGTMISDVAEYAPEWKGKFVAWQSMSGRLEPSGRVLREAGELHDRGRATRTRTRWIGGLAAAAALTLILWQRPTPDVARGPGPPLLQADRAAANEVAALAGESTWLTPAARGAVIRANREIDRGVDALTRALEERPGDARIIELLGRSIQHRQSLGLELWP